MIYIFSLLIHQDHLESLALHAKIVPEHFHDFYQQTDLLFCFDLLACYLLVEKLIINRISITLKGQAYVIFNQESHRPIPSNSQIVIYTFFGKD